MAHTLKTIPFMAEYVDSPAVRSFSCGSEPWEREVAAWIKGEPGGVLDDVQRGCEVWLYITDEDGLVGYGSLSPSR